MTHAVEVKAMYAHAKPHWETILLNVAFPLMCFSDEDAQLWEEDPHEYIRKGYDILEDMYRCDRVWAWGGHPTIGSAL